ncbi:hypothetical protein GCM10009410_33300 [Shewanella ulleungensis]|uniref:Uncharacterized protein n=1 Tax=Shewanella ulleungensis TaxID=2282699 RepID=A0ABQ2QT98_9GAMM|nr:hypothetical protein GCM10009410_33300 [Shewanella ulleungensis]
MSNLIHLLSEIILSMLILRLANVNLTLTQLFLFDNKLSINDNFFISTIISLSE